MTLNVSDMMTKKLESIEGTASVQETAKKMKDTNVSSLLVLDAEIYGAPPPIIKNYLLFRISML